MADIDRIKAQERREQTPVGFCQAWTRQISLCWKRIFQFVECIEQLAECFFIGILCGGKARTIDAIVDVRIDEVVQRINLAA